MGRGDVMATDTMKIGGGAGVSAIVVQIVNEIFGYFEAGRVAALQAAQAAQVAAESARVSAQQAAGTESYLELISTMANNCR